MIDFEKLKAPFPPDKISWRIGSIGKDFSPERGGKAIALAYIDARDVMDRLDEVCGPAGWQCKYSHANGKTVCDLAIYISSETVEEWVWKADGAGDSDIEAEKGALSDAFKRAAVRWGIGRYLYDLPAPWVAIDKFKKILPQELERLAGMLPNATPGLKVSGLNGQSKTPAKFWDNPSLHLVMPKKVSDAERNEQIKWLTENFRHGVDKAPTRELLAKFQSDNASWIDALPAETTNMLYEACSIRAEQFDHEGRV